MAFIQINIMSEALLRNVNINAIIPVDSDPLQRSSDLTIPKDTEKYPALYLLHGIFGNQNDWGNMTVIQRLAEKKKIAVIMPSGDNKFYIDHPETHDYYGSFIGEELVDITRKLFPISLKKQSTFIGGLSMGGYGALRNGLKYHNTFGAVAGLSTANFVDMDIERSEPINAPFLTAIFGNLEEAKCNELSVDYLIRKNAEQNRNDQKIYLACGNDDVLFNGSEKMCVLFKRMGYDITFEHGPGGHDWDFWNTYVQRMIDWLPIDELDKSS